MMKKEPTTGLVLAGGGAKGAYEAGVLLYIWGHLSKQRDVEIRLDLFSGTSAGALNSCALASMAQEPARAARLLAEFWRGLTLERVLGFGKREFANFSKLVFGRKNTLRVFQRQEPRPKADPHQPVAGLFNTRRLQADLERAIPWRSLQQNLSNGTVRGISLCATEVCTGLPVVFYQPGHDAGFHESPDSIRAARKVAISLQHAIASAAIPFLFPSIQIDGTCYVDGGLRQNTPINPALRFGADRLLVVSLSRDPDVDHHHARIGCRKNPYPGVFFLMDRMLTALLTETLDYDLKRLQLFNGLIENGIALYGEEFLQNMNRLSRSHRNADWKIVKPLLIRPSVGLNDIALDALSQHPEEIRLPGLFGKLVEKTISSQPVAASGFISYLMFTPTYLGNLIDLGFSDARAMEDEILAFFSSPNPAA